MKKQIILGINYGAHDTSAAIGINGDIVAACEQERFDGNKHSRQFPREAINECLKIARLKISNVDEIALTADHSEIIKKFYLERAKKDPSAFDFLIQDIEKIKFLSNFKKIIRKNLKFKKRISNFRHHLCHIASAYYPSGFNKALVLSNDGMGEFETGLVCSANKGKIKVLDDGPKYPNSLGLIYSAITYFLGWKHHCDEGIVMGLAPLGNYNNKIKGEKYIDIFRKIIKHKSDFNYEINKEWIAYHLKRNVWVSKKFTETFGKKREYGAKILNKHKDIAAALQKRVEEITIKSLTQLRKRYKYDKLCIAGGVGLNCSLNGKIESSKLFNEIFVQPASGDAGAALGAVYCAFSKNNPNLYKNKKNKMTNHYLGSRYKDKEIIDELTKKKIKFEKSKNISLETARLLKEGKIVAWFQGPSEFGPRSLGNRSILCKPFPSGIKDYINNRVKFRESFRPFAPSVLLEDLKNFFDIKQESPHMLIACKVKKNKKNLIPATVHIDDTCRVQSVSKNTNLKFYNLLKNFKKLTGCPVLLNTSFNIKGQPMVNDPEQAIKTFLNTKIDVLVLHNLILRKKNNP